MNAYVCLRARSGFKRHFLYKSLDYENFGYVNLNIVSKNLYDVFCVKCRNKKNLDWVILINILKNLYKGVFAKTNWCVVGLKMI